MGNRARTVVGLLLLTPGLAGCAGSVPSSDPLAPSALSPTPHTTYPAYPASGTLVGVSLSGRVSEATSAGLVPLEGVSVYCDECGEFGHTWVTTGADGLYSFSGDVGQGGGIWLAPGYTTYLIVTKDGYKDPLGLPAPTWPSPTPTGWREAAVSGDTRFDIQLIRR